MALHLADPVIVAARRPALLSYVRNRQCVLFVGAGLSRSAGYPGWGELMATVIKKTSKILGSDSADPELQALLKAGRFAELADQCRELLGPERFATVLRAELDKSTDPPEATHRAIVETPYASIVTTNFDTLLEDAYARWSDAGIPKCPTGAQLGRHGSLLLDRTFFILKAHGTIHDAASMVFTSEDYRRITHANPAFQAMMSAILLSHAVIFVGYSLSDPNFRLLLDSQLSVFGTQSPPRYALMEGVGSTESDVLRRTTGIEVIPYPKGKYESVAVFLGEIAAATKPKTLGRAANSTVLRARTPLPALCVAIRPRGALLDIEWFETTTDDLDGVRVPAERRHMGSTSSLRWDQLRRATTNSGDMYSGWDVRQIGTTITAPLADLGVPLAVSRNQQLTVLDVPNELAALPWEWVMVDQNFSTPLCMWAPLCRRVPGLDDASRGRPFLHSPLRVLVVGDALADSKSYSHPLKGTREEAQEIANLFRTAKPAHDVTLLVGAEASYTRVLEELATGYDIVHMTGVAYLGDNGESVIPLNDGWVSASELATLLIQRPPSLLFVNEDYSGFVWSFGDAAAVATSFADLYHRLQQRRPGLERVVARAGVGTFIGCMAPSTEKIASAIAVAFYTRLLAGDAVSHALFHARVAAKSWEDQTALLFAMEGYPDTRIVETPAKSSPRATWARVKTKGSKSKRSR